MTIVYPYQSQSQKGMPGASGKPGNGIADIIKINTVGLVDTYRILFTNGTYTDYDVTNGIIGSNGIDGVDGKGIASHILFSTVGLVKTYRITYTDATTFDYVVTDGTDGTGTGDVVGPATNTNDYIPQWDGANSKILKDGIPTSTFAPALGADDNYVTDAEKVKLSNLSGTNSGDNATNTTSNSYADGKVVATISNGDTTHASSSDALFDALALKAPIASPTFTGTVILPNSQALVTPVLGTPTSGTLTNCTGLPIVGLVASTSTAIGVGSIELGHATDTTISRDSAGIIAVEGKKVSTYATTTEASNATPTPAISATNHTHTVTALAVGATFGAPTGTPFDGQSLILRVKDNGTARTLAFNAIYRASSDLSFPTTTVINKTLYMGFKYNSSDSKWDLLAVLNNI